MVLRILVRRVPFEELLVDLAQMNKLIKDWIRLGVIFSSKIKTLLHTSVQVIWQLEILVFKGKRDFEKVIKAELFQELLVKAMLMILFEEKEHDSCQVVRVFV